MSDDDEDDKPLSPQEAMRKLKEGCIDKCDPDIACCALLGLGLAGWQRTMRVHDGGITIEITKPK